MGELFDKEMKAQKGNLKKLRGSRKLLQSPWKSVRWKWKNNLRKNEACVKMLLMEWNALYRVHTKNRWNDLDKLRVNDSGHNEDAICLANGWMGAKGMAFWAWAHERAPLNLQWLVPRIGGSDFLHCWVTDSI